MGRPADPVGRVGTRLDYVAVSDGRGGLAGYIPRAALRDPSGRSTPVYDKQLNVVGTWVHGRGFVRPGEDPASLPSRAGYTIGHADGSTETGTIGVNGGLIPDAEPDPRRFPPHLRPQR